MCVTIIQRVGYSVPYKKIELVAKSKDQDTRKILQSLKRGRLSNRALHVFYVFEQRSTCECGITDGCGFKFERNTCKALSMDEAEEKKNDIGTKRTVLKEKLEKIGLLSYATWGYFTDADPDTH